MKSFILEYPKCGQSRVDISENYLKVLYLGSDSAGICYLVHHRRRFFPKTIKKTLESSFLTKIRPKCCPHSIQRSRRSRSSRPGLLLTHRDVLRPKHLTETLTVLGILDFSFLAIARSKYKGKHQFHSMFRDVRFFRFWCQISMNTDKT